MQSSDGDSGTPIGSTALPTLDGVGHRFVDLPGLRVHVAEAGSGPPVLLLHGFPEHWWGWRKVLPALAEHHRVIAPDLRGAGWTDAPPDGYTEEQLVADAVSLLDALGLDRVDVVGLDIGGILGFRLCLAHPDRVRRFVVMGAPHPYPALSGWLLVRVLLNVWRLWPRFAVTLPVLGPRLVSRGRQRLARHMLLGDAPDGAVWSAADIETYLGRLRDPARARAAVALYRALAVTASNRAARGAYRGTRLVTPTLGLYGAVLVEDDRDASGHPRLLLGYEPYADDMRMVHVPGTGYYLAEEQPEAVVRHVLEFFHDG
ncbi:alpha/beta fold hydrolase [Cellulomonas carbonis]|uniref:Hydrolase n=1 Tax=Cellulomonas carbonis T26 TaxID=947969 RepID=A0A0A0BQY3_9CELL|nr:alpha/beta hydrolase [Cellulomonas carbonis]KGM10376.1 hydrolase [Cellulomonas carbonis T26]GGB99773.1 epoxide hydrolase EphF [Cellulomonas carbonis]